MFHLLLAAAPVSLLPCAALHLPASVYIAATAARPAVYQQRARCAVAIIEPSIYQELAIYDMKMEQSVNDLESQLTQARQEAAESNRRLDTLEETVNTLQTESAQQRAEAESLRQQLDKQEKQAKANAAAASKLEEETRRLLKELDDKGERDEQLRHDPRDARLARALELEEDADKVRYHREADGTLKRPVSRDADERRDAAAKDALRAVQAARRRALRGDIARVAAVDVRRGVQERRAKRAAARLTVVARRGAAAARSLARHAARPERDCVGDP